MIRKSVQNLKPYTPGEQPKIPNIVKLNTNENAYPPSPKVAAALRDFTTGALNLYPDPLCSRIREHRTLRPRCATELVFTAREASFDPQALAAELKGQVAACSVLAGTAHGFMNPASPHFLPALAASEVERLRRRLVALQGR